jgi:exosortase H (IPTLxxWG-CTERM-specific)
VQRPARFATIFAACFLTGIGILLTPPVQAVDARVSRALVKVSHTLIGVCGGTASVEGAVLRDPASGFAVEMKDGCNALNVTILLWSAVIAFSAPWRLKAVGLVAGGLILQILNIVRFISLFYLGQYSRTWFDFAHNYLWESLLVLDTMVLFWLWGNRVSRSESAPDVAP